ncbi:MAG TPA: RsmE family RNA methyltransferase [Chroococcales cyanobacterium]|jgi:16S rRNA (uracil1498-N3)-methyltransferase
MARFFLSPEDLRGDRFFLRGEDLHHALRVLRLREKDSVVLLDGKGGSFFGHIEQIGKSEASGILTGPAPSAGDLPITLACALLRGEKFDLVIQKSTELGVRRIQPIVTERCVSHGEKLSRWRRIAKEAAEQCERLFLPEILPPVPLASLEFEKISLFCSERGGEKLPASLAKIELKGFSGRILAVVGPEGGFTSSEAELLVSKGASPVSLGKRILRAETAAVAVMSMLLYRFLADDFNPA